MAKAKAKAVEHSKLYQLAYDCYVIRGTWNKAMLGKVRDNGSITQEEYDEIIEARENR